MKNLMQQDGDAADATIEKMVGNHKTLHSQHCQTSAKHNQQQIARVPHFFPVHRIASIFSFHCKQLNNKCPDKLCLRHSPSIQKSKIVVNASACLFFTIMVCQKLFRVGLPYQHWLSRHKKMKGHKKITLKPGHKYQIMANGRKKNLCSYLTTHIFVAK